MLFKNLKLYNIANEPKPFIFGYKAKTELNNIGKNIEPYDIFIFKEYDIEEGGNDWIYLNRKRKEMLMMKHLIYPYIGSYKSIINAINFFGFNDLQLNEYYRNVDPDSINFLKLFKVEIPDIFDNTVKGNLSPLLFEYRPFFLSLMDNGRTLEVIGAEGNNITLNEKQYRLLGFNIHKPSKTAFNGERAEMSIQLVHQHFDGSKVIVEVMLSSSPKLFEAAKKSWWDSAPKENSLFQVLLNHVPLVKNQVASPRDVAINPQQLLPEDRTYFTYMGSLTEPPCTEGVTWIVMKNPILVSAQQVHSFGQIYNNNVRPLQIKGDRIIKESR